MAGRFGGFWKQRYRIRLSTVKLDSFANLYFSCSKRQVILTTLAYTRKETYHAIGRITKYWPVQLVLKQFFITLNEVIKNTLIFPVALKKPRKDTSINLTRRWTDSFPIYFKSLYLYISPVALKNQGGSKTISLPLSLTKKSSEKSFLTSPAGFKKPRKKSLPRHWKVHGRQPNSGHSNKYFSIF